MSEASRKSKHTSSDPTTSVTSLPESESGVTRSVSPAGPITDLFGQEVAPVLASAVRAKAQGLMTLATSGRLGRNSSASENLQRSLESKLMMRLDTAGSTLFKLTWKARRTPLGRRYLERVALAHRTSANGCTSWPTPRKPKFSHDFAKILREPGRTSASDLESAAHLSSWPTPTGEDSQCAGSRKRGLTLHSGSKACGWASPSARDWKDTAGMPKTGINPDGSERTRTDQLPRQASLTVSGEMRIGYSARDGIVRISSGAQLNPEHSRWLMALPTVFSSCADTAMQFVRKSRKRSSKRICHSEP